MIGQNQRQKPKEVKGPKLVRVDRFCSPKIGTRTLNNISVYGQNTADTTALALLSFSGSWKSRDLSCDLIFSLRVISLAALESESLLTCLQYRFGSLTVVCLLLALSPLSPPLFAPNPFPFRSAVITPVLPFFFFSSKSS